MQLDEDIQQHLVLLPLHLKAEVLDFVLFLEQKQEKQGFFSFNDEQNIIKLDEQQQQNFVESLLNPTINNEKLKRSAQSYKDKMGL